MNTVYQTVFSFSSEQVFSRAHSLTQEVIISEPGESHTVTFALSSCASVRAVWFQPASESLLLELISVTAMGEDSFEISPDYVRSNALWESEKQFLFHTNSPYLLYVFPDPMILSRISFTIVYRASGMEVYPYIIEQLKTINETKEAELKRMAKVNGELEQRFHALKLQIEDYDIPGTLLERCGVAAKIIMPRGTAIRRIIGSIAQSFRYFFTFRRKVYMEAKPVSEKILNPERLEDAIHNNWNAQCIPSFSDILKRSLERSRNTVKRRSQNLSKVAFTIVSKNHLHRALVLRDSFLDHNPAFDFIIFLVDMAVNKEEIHLLSLLIESGVDIRCFHELRNAIPFRNFEHMLLKYTIIEANKAFKPFCFDYLMQYSYQRIFYLDSDILVMGSFDEAANMLERSSVAVTPYIVQPFRDNCNLSELDILKKGIYNLGFLALKNNATSRKLIEWWEEKLFKQCYLAENENLFADQRWADLFSSFIHDLHIIKNRGYNAAYWNLPERKISRHGNIWFAGNDQLIFFHFSGMVGDELTAVTPDQNPVIRDYGNDMIELLREYRKRLCEFVLEMKHPMEYYYDYMPACTFRINNTKRRAVTENNVPEDFNPFISSHTDKCAIYSEPLLSELCDKAGAFQKTGDSLEESAGLSLAGHFSNITGISQVARSFARNLFRTAIPFTLKNYHISSHAEIKPHEFKEFAHHFSDDFLYRLVLFFINYDEISYYDRINRNEITRGHHRAAVWWWEFESGFERFMAAFEYVDEVIVFSDFLKNFFSSIAPKHIRVNKLRYPFQKDWKIIESSDVVRKSYALPMDEYIFFFHFDCSSSIMRKNPAAVVEAFAGAFQGNVKGRLILKMNRGSEFSFFRKQLSSMIHKLGVEGRILIINEPMSRNELMALINAADCYVSLHRGEGLGLGILEAMALGKPVICTAYGGNMEFTREDNSFLVGYTMVDAKPDIDAFRGVRQWAEPSIEQAVDYMRNLYDDRNVSMNTGEKARQFIQSYFAVERSTLDILNYVKDRL